MRRNAFSEKRGAFALCRRDVFGNNIIEAIMAQGFAASIGKDYIGGLAIALPHPGTESGDSVLAQRGATLPPSFPYASDMGAGSQNYVLATKSYQFGSA